MSMAKPICNWMLYECAILSDGRVTTCCLDAYGRNAFANIYEHDWRETFLIRFYEFRKRFVSDIKSLPTCCECMMAFANKGVNTPDASQEEVEAFLSPNHIPPNMVIELTSLCNLNCIACPQSQPDFGKSRLGKNGRNIEIGHLMNWIMPIVKNIKLVRLYNYGESFLHRGAIDFCSFLTETNSNIEVDVATNGILLDSREKIVQLINAKPKILDFSIHGGSQATIEKYMGPGANLDKVITNLRLILTIREAVQSSLPVVGWKCVLFRWNDSDEEMDKVRHLAREIGVDFYGFDLTTGPYASQRFLFHNRAWQSIVKQRECYFDRFWDYLNSNVLEKLRSLVVG
jgi:MoaA/NifB/PqqE/SkfB family radical SAM enzyme